MNNSGGRQGGRDQNRRREPKEFDEKVIQVNRVSKKTKGGNQMGFSVLVVVGDKKGRVGVGLGKAKDVLSSIQKAVKKAKRRLLNVPIQGTTIPFAIEVKFGAAHIILKPAPAGSGIIAGGAIRAVVDAAGIRDISSKIKGTSNPASNVYATMKALTNIRALVDTKGIVLKSVIEAEKIEKEKMRELAAVAAEAEQIAQRMQVAKKEKAEEKTEVQGVKVGATSEVKTEPKKEVKVDEKRVKKAKKT